MTADLQPGRLPLHREPAMPPTSTCPDPLELQGLLQQRLPGAEADRLLAHLAQCPRCAARYASLKQASEPDTGSSIPDRTAAGAPAADSAPTLDRTAALSLSSQEDPPTVFSAPVDFLGPAQGVDEIGRLGPYRVLRLLGSGGMGVVYEAEDTRLKRPIALKALRPAVATSMTARQRFLREAQATAALNHDHVVRIHQVGEDRGVPFLAMQLLRGETLADRLKRQGKLSIAEVLRIGRETAEGLAAAHEHGLIHRDIKPANIFLEERHHGRVKLLDFGLARALEAETQISQSGLVAGTPQYIAPEQAEGLKVDARADLFSLGCVLYRMATGEVPFSGATLLAVFRSLAVEQARDPRLLNPEVPAALAGLILHLLAKRPEDRPPSAEVVAHALAAIERHPDLAGPEDTVIAPVPRAAARRRRRLVLLLAPVLVAVLAVGGFLLLDDLRRHAATPPDGKGPVATDKDTPPVEPPALAIAPFSAATARQHQERWARALGRQAKEANALGMALVLIPPGQFLMGTEAAEIEALLKDPANQQQTWPYVRAEGPPHQVKITRPFLLGAYEVTVGQFRAFAEATGHQTDAERGADKDNWRTPGWATADDEPVVCVTWNDAVAFCRWLSQREGKTYRLPTEAEWEYACRAGTTTLTYYGNSLSSKQANFDGDAPFRAVRGPYLRRAAKVGSYAPNAWGLYDMHGNAWEHCADWYDATYYGQSPVEDPKGPANGHWRVIRGGGWFRHGVYCRSATREAYPPTGRWTNTGFRVVCELPGPEQPEGDAP
jgi:formylglycine-generating enzyme required for sulfatase activity